MGLYKTLPISLWFALVHRTAPCFDLNHKRYKRPPLFPRLHDDAEDPYEGWHLSHKLSWNTFLNMPPPPKKKHTVTLQSNIEPLFRFHANLFNPLMLWLTFKTSRWDEMTVAGLWWSRSACLTPCLQYSTAVEKRRRCPPEFSCKKTKTKHAQVMFTCSAAHPNARCVEQYCWMDFFPIFFKHLESYIDYIYVCLLAVFLHCLWHIDTFVDALLLPAVSLRKSGKPMAGWS